ncbi:MAG: UDP-2,4-diacetamido-2,4, 6-trideoxy-beta-L-altropyranose hydrolase [Pseudomonadota bacterium]
MRIALRADASSQIGTGHVMRSLTLADALAQRHGATCTFVCRELPAALAARLSAAGHAVARLPPAARGARTAADPPHADWLAASQEVDAAQTCAVLPHGCDGLIVDHYALDARWGAAVGAATGARLLVIDDLGDRDLEADLLLDQNLQPADGLRYAGRLPSRCRPLLGPGYALLRPEFAAARGEAPRGAPRIFVFLSGADPDDHTGAVLRALDRRLPPQVEVEAVVGELHPHKDALSALCAARPGWALQVNVSDMARRMSRAHLAVGTGGSTTWERCAVGLPSALVAMADNQVQVVHEAARAGVALDLGDLRDGDVDAIAASAAHAIQDPALLARLREACLALVDGLGAARVADVFADMVRGQPCAGELAPSPAGGG